MEVTKTPIERLQMGAVIEKLNHAFAEALENVLDPNTRATALREVSLKIKIKPDQNRETANYEIHCSSKLAAAIESAGVFFIGKDGDGCYAMESNPDQGLLNLEAVGPVEYSQKMDVIPKGEQE